MAYIELEGRADWDRFEGALRTSFGIKYLERFVRRDFEKIWRDIYWEQAIGLVVYDLVNLANQQGNLDRLIVALASERPDRPDVRALALFYSQREGWTATFETHGLPIGSALESLTTVGDPFIDITRLAQWMICVERQVCQVRCGNEHGTGFLIAPDLVMTCYHVVKGHLDKEVDASAVQVRFDYRCSEARVEPPYSSGKWFDIDGNWRIPNAPYSKADITLEKEPADNELDFAILKLNEPLGSQQPAGDDKVRGWIDLSKDPPTPEGQSPILIVQHPGREQQPPPQMPLQIAFTTPGFDGLNSSRTRLAYLPSTRPGSSGSPVFDRELQAVALHHNRGQIDPNAKDLVKNNRGIPLGKIRAALTEETRSLLISPPGSD